MDLNLPKANHQHASDPRLTLYALSSGALLPFVKPPLHDGEIAQEVHEIARTLRPAINALEGYDNAARTAKADQTLSDLGRVQKVGPLKDKAAAEVKAASAALDGVAANYDKFEASVLAPPALEPTDVAGALIDQEIRNYVRTLSSDDLSKYLQAMGKNPRHLIALARSPVPIGFATEAATRMWREHALETNPEAAKLSRMKEALEWGRVVVSAVSQHV